MNLQARQELYVSEVEHYFRARLVDRYDETSAALWSRDYSSEQAFLGSVEGRRGQWRELLAPPELTRTSDVEVRDCDVPGGQWIVVRLNDHLSAQGLLVVPEGATRLVVFQHGLGSTPERVMGLGDSSAYDGVGQKLVDAGYAVLAPMNLIHIPQRNRAQSLARLAGTTMEGLEFSRFQHLLAAASELAPDVDFDGYAMTGMSWGGLATQFWTPLDERIEVAATLGFFNQRSNKMVVQDTRYGTFYDFDEHHAFLQGHLLGFGDADLASLICPRPFMVQHGRADRIGWWPQVVEEFGKAKAHWEQLGLDDRVSLQLHEGGHDVDAAGLIRWLGQHFPSQQ